MVRIRVLVIYTRYFALFRSTNVLRPARSYTNVIFKLVRVCLTQLLIEQESTLVHGTLAVAFK